MKNVVLFFAIVSVVVGMSLPAEGKTLESTSVCGQIAAVDVQETALAVTSDQVATEVATESEDESEPSSAGRIGRGKGAAGKGGAGRGKGGVGPGGEGRGKGAPGKGGAGHGKGAPGKGGAGHGKGKAAGRHVVTE